MLLRPRTMVKMVIMKDIANESYQKDTRLIDKMSVQYLSQNMIDTNMIMENHHVVIDRKRIRAKN